MRDIKIRTLTFFNGPSPTPFSFIFVFSNKHDNFYKCPPSIRCWDSSPWPSRHESSPINTRPGLPDILVADNNTWVNLSPIFYQLPKPSVCLLLLLNYTQNPIWKLMLAISWIRFRVYFNRRINDLMIICYFYFNPFNWTVSIMVLAIGQKWLFAHH